MRFRLISVASLLLVASSVACAADDAWTLSTSTDVRYFNWFGNLGIPATGAQPRASGDEFYTPYAFELVGHPSNDYKIDIIARGGGVWARNFTPGFSGEVDTTTDSAVAGTVTYYGWKGIQPFVSINFNLPTGDTLLAGSQLNARMNPDLVDISSFGEGFNVGPTVGFTLPLTSSLLLSASAGYTWRGGYNQDGLGTKTTFVSNGMGGFDNLGVPIAVVNRVEPGQVFTLTGAIGYQVGQLQVTLTGAFSHETQTNFVPLTSLQDPTIESGVAPFEPGNRFFLSGDISYAWGNAGTTLISASATHSANNSALFGTVQAIGCGPGGAAACEQTTQAQTVQTELFNSNSDFFRIGLEHRFLVGQLSIGPVASYLLREANGYAPGTLQFVPQAQRWSAGAVMSYPVTNKATFNARAEHVWLDSGGRPASCTPTSGGEGMTSALLGNFCIPAIEQSALSRDDWQGVVGLSYQF